MRVWANSRFLLLLVGLAGCYADPFANPGDWSSPGAPRKNVAIQAATPSQLIAGQPGGSSNGVAASAAIDKALGGAAGTATGLETPPPPTTLNITGS